MRRPGYLFVILSLILLTAYQHFAIQKVKRNADSQIAEMRTQNRELKNQVAQSELQIQDLIEQRETIERDLVEVKGKLMAIEETLGRAENQLAYIGRENKTVLEKVSALIENKRLLEARVAHLMTEKEELDRRMHDLRELKLAIKEVKRSRVEQKITLLKAKDRELLAQGNRGFLVVGGQSTLQAKGRVNVIPLPTHPMAKSSQEGF